jgi:putative membrane-bound dehydrogenase-like protein
MARLILASGLLIAIAVGVSGEKNEKGEPAKPKTHQVKLNGHVFTLPVGFEIELAAGPDLVKRPIEADFDEQGRLYVSDSSGSNENVQEQLKKKPHRVVRLEDSKGTGKFDKSTVFADKLMFPEGVMWHAGSLYVAAPPSIWKLTDTKGKGVADERVEWFQGKTLTGCANDLHGPYLGPDGWIYWCKGAFAEQTYVRPGGKTFATRAAHIFRARPDGTGIEPVMTGGMDNPVEVAFTPGGERIFTTTFFQHPGGGKRDGLVHAIYGGIYGKDHGVIYDHPWTSPQLMPVLTHLGAAAPCGLCRYESRVFGAAYQDNLFACLFNMHKVTRHVLEADGATFKSRDEDFLVSDNLDFHPTDVLEDADGSLLVIDTGGWYKLCCPTSQLHKPDVLGAIYRIRRTGAPHIVDPRGLKLAWANLTTKELTGLLDDPRPAVRRRAIELLGGKGESAVELLVEVVRSSKSAEARRNAVWAATRIDEVKARRVARLATRDADETVRQAALHSISVRRDRAACPDVYNLLSSKSPGNRRAAAEAMGRLGVEPAVPGLLRQLGEPADRALEHSLIYALIEIADHTGTAKGLKSENPRIKRAALIALDQMKDGGLKAEIVAKELNSPDPRLKEAAWWIAGRHPDWGDTLAGFLRERLAVKDLPAAEQTELISRLARFTAAAPVRELLTKNLNDASAPTKTRLIVLKAMAQSSLKEAPPEWITGVTEVLTCKNPELRREAIVTARSLRLPKKGTEDLLAVLLQIGQQPREPDDMRLQALAALPGGLTKVEPQLFDFLRSMLPSERKVTLRGASADVLSRATLNSEQLIKLTESLAKTGPMEVDRLLEPFARSTDEKVGLRLVAALKDERVRSSLRLSLLKPHLEKYPAAVKKQAEELYALLNEDASQEQAKLEKLLASLKDGDIRRGQAVFNSQKAACSACHAIGYLGGNVGPDLTQIGKIRSERDLLESIVFPSASIVRSYEPVLVATKDGKFHNGLIRKETPEEIVLATGPNQEMRIARKDIEDIQPSKISVMPAGLDQQLSTRELADLVAFLKACK